MRKFMTMQFAVALLAMSTTAFAIPPFLQDFEVGTTGVSGYTRVASGTGGVPSAGGSSWHATSTTGTDFSSLGGYDPTWAGGFVASMDVYFNMSGTEITTTGLGFDLTQALNQTTLFLTTAHMVDIVFVVGADTATDSVLVGASTNTNGVGMGIGSGSAGFLRGGGGVLAAPKEFFATGWYTFQWDIHDNGGFVEAELNVIKPDTTVENIHTWQLLGWTGSGSAPIPTSGAWHTGTTNTVGGHRYMWLLNERPTSGIAVDNIQVQAQAAPIPLPAAAWAGMGLLGLIGAGRSIRRHRAS